jgi:hypothetical protein
VRFYIEIPPHPAIVLWPGDTLSLRVGEAEHLYELHGTTEAFDLEMWLLKHLGALKKFKVEVLGDNAMEALAAEVRKAMEPCPSTSK